MQEISGTTGKMNVENQMDLGLRFDARTGEELRFGVFEG